MSRIRVCRDLVVVLTLAAGAGGANAAGMRIQSLPSDPDQPDFVCHGFDGTLGPCASLPGRIAKEIWIGADGSGDYPDLTSASFAISTWCGTPSSSNECLMRLGPGVHDMGSLTLVMFDFVHIHGAGIDVTTIKGSRSSTSAGVVNLASASLESLTVKNDNVSGSGTHIAIYAPSGSGGPRLREVRAWCQNPSTCYGIYNNGAYSLELERVDVYSNSTSTASSDDAYGIYNAGGDFVRIRDSAIRVYDAADDKYGVRNNGQVRVDIRDTLIETHPGSLAGDPSGSAHYGI